MSFNVNWHSLDTADLRSWTSELLTGALNSGKRPNILASDITIKDLNFGRVAPEFEILEIGELEKDRFRGIFKINYSGDFHLTLHTQVQANPLKIYSDNMRDLEINDGRFITPDFLSSTDAFNIPLDLKLSDIKISGIGILVFLKAKGLTMVFRNDPLDSIKVSSTFDTVKVLLNFLQKQIENQIRDLFRETLPTLIHKVSLKYTTSNQSNDFMNNLHDHLKIHTDSDAVSMDPLELESVAAINLHRLAELFNSRETLDMNIPKLRRIVQRNHLEKFHRNRNPSLASSLYLNLRLDAVPGHAPNSNSIPVELLANHDFGQVDDMVKEISAIQAKSFKAGNPDGKRAKRRTIKLGKRSAAPKRPETPAATNETPLSPLLTATLVDSPAQAAKEATSMSVLSTQNSIYHPTPTKAAKVQRPALYRLENTEPEGRRSSNMPSPLNSNLSFVGSVGLGTSFLHMGLGTTLASSPFRPDSSKFRVYDEVKLQVKQSMNRVNIDSINEKLQQQLSINEKKSVSKRDEVRAMKKKLDAYFDLPPPPYHQTPRAQY